MTAPEFGETNDIKLAFQQASDIAVLATGTVADLIPKTTYTIQFTEEEQAIGFPSVLNFPDPNTTNILVHSGSFDDFVEDLTADHPDLTREDVVKIHVAGSVIPHIFATNVDPSDTFAVGMLADYMESRDVLDASLADCLLEFGEEHTGLMREAILTRSVEEIARINRLRLAIGVLLFYEGKADFIQDGTSQSGYLGDRLAAAFRKEVARMPESFQQYKRMTLALGGDEHEARNRFFSSISHEKLACAFPMTIDEIMLVAKYCRT